MFAILSHFKFKSPLTGNRGEISYVEYSFQTVAVESLCYFLQVEVLHLSWESLERAFLQVGIPAVTCWHMGSSDALIPWASGIRDETGRWG